MRTQLLLLALLFSVLPAAAAECPALLDHRYQTVQGGTLNLCDYADRPILVVNTASKCGFTPQFEKLEGMYKTYRAKGLMVVGFPPTTSARSSPPTRRSANSACSRTTCGSR